MSFLRKATLVNSTEFFCLALSVAQAAILARVLGPAGVGQYDLIRSALVLTSQLCCLGFPLSFLYHSQNYPENTKEYIMNTIWSMLSMGTIGGVGLVLLVFIKSNYFGFVPWFALIGIGLYVPILLSQVIARNALLIQIEAQGLSMMRVSRIAGAIVLILIFYYAGILGVAQALLCFVFAALTGSLVGWIWARKYVDLSKRPSWGVVRQLMSMGVRLSWADLMVLVNGQLNILIIKYLLDDFETVGYFSRGQRVAMLVMIAGQAVMPLLFSRWASFPRERLSGHVEKVMRFATSVSMIMVAVVLLTGKWAIIVLYGGKFLPAVIPMMILVPGAALYLLSRALMQLLGSRGVPELSAATLLAGAAINVFLCWLLIPKMGITGAAWASTAGNIVLLVLLMLIVKKKYNVRIMQCICLRKTDLQGILKQLQKGKRENNGSGPIF